LDHLVILVTLLLLATPALTLEVRDLGLNLEIPGLVNISNY